MLLSSCILVWAALYYPHKWGAASWPDEGCSCTSWWRHLEALAEPHKCERINPTTSKPCNTIFSRSYDLTRHEDTIHNACKQKVGCILCIEEKIFSRNDALTRHMVRIHPQHHNSSDSLANTSAACRPSRSGLCRETFKQASEPRLSANVRRSVGAPYKSVRNTPSLSILQRSTWSHHVSCSRNKRDTFREALITIYLQSFPSAWDRMWLSQSGHRAAVRRILWTLILPFDVKRLLRFFNKKISWFGV